MKAELNINSKSSPEAVARAIVEIHNRLKLPLVYGVVHFDDGEE